MADYVELPGREIDKTPFEVIYTTRGVATTAADTSAPKPLATLAGTSGHSLPALCDPGVRINETRYPKRFYFTATWRAPLTRAEFAALGA